MEYILKILSHEKLCTWQSLRKNVFHSKDIFEKNRMNNGKCFRWYNTNKRMTKDSIIKLWDERDYILKTKCLDIKGNKDALIALSEMKSFVSDHANWACWLSLPQIWILGRWYVARMWKLVEVFINPRIEYRGFKKADDESCLSEPWVKKMVLRNEAITVRYTNLSWEKKILKLAWLYARIVQHEQDHLEWILLVDK
jgi:peptide deformylase